MIGTLFAAIADFLALIGGIALILRLARTATQFTLISAEAVAAAGLADAGARRGDLTAMSEGRQTVQRARVARRTSLALALIYIAWLLIPVGLGVIPEAYALAAPLWLLPLAPTIRRK